MLKIIDSKSMATFGLAPYLLESLVEKVKDDCFVLLFDESLNKKEETRMMKSLVDAKRLQGSICDKILQQFEHFMRSVLSSELLQSKPGQDRLDIFLHDKMCTPYPRLWMAVRMALLLSHGQATGFLLTKRL